MAPHAWPKGFSSATTRPPAYFGAVTHRLPTATLLASYLAAALAFASAAVTAYWMLGGTALLDTVGGALERYARDRSADALVLALVVVAAKCAAGAVAVVLTRRPSRRLATLAAPGGGLLALYGAVLTLAGALVLIGVIASSPENEHALRWHVFLWDPWFLLWGLALALAGISIRRGASRPSGRRRRRSVAPSAP
jgi:hypothetical protein